MTWKGASSYSCNLIDPAVCALWRSHRIWWIYFSLCRGVSCGELIIQQAGRTIIIITASCQCPEWSIPAAAVFIELCNPQREPSVHQDKATVQSWDRLLFTVQHGHTHLLVSDIWLWLNLWKLFSCALMEIWWVLKLVILITFQMTLWNTRLFTLYLGNRARAHCFRQN